MEANAIRESCITRAHVMISQDAKPAGHVHGGVIMKYIDTTAGVVVARPARCNVVTASIDRLDFIHPVYVGQFSQPESQSEYAWDNLHGGRSPGQDGGFSDWRGAPHHFRLSDRCCAGRERSAKEGTAPHPENGRREEAVP